MRTRGKDKKSKKREKRNHAPLRRSLRLKLLAATLSTDRCTKAKIPQEKVTKAKARKVQYVCDSVKKRRKGSLVLLSKASKQNKQISKFKLTTHVSTEDKQFTSTTATKETTSKHVTCREKRTTPLKEKPKTIRIKQSNKLKKTNVEFVKGTVSTQYEKRIRKLRLIKTIKIEQNYYEDANITRFSDVAFLDDNHILALDDNWTKEKQGQRICCICIDGSLVCDLLVPGYPWSVVVLSQTEAVVSMRGLGSNGLLWISIDIDNKSMEITRNIPFETETFGLSYTDRSESFVVSYSGQSYMSVLNRKGEEMKKIPCQMGLHYRCLILDDNNILFLDNSGNTVSIMNQEGKVMSSLKHISIKEPVALETDCFGSIYVGTFRNAEILKFERNGKYLATFQCIPKVCGFGIDRKSDRIVVASENSLFVYSLENNV